MIVFRRQRRYHGGGVFDWLGPIVKAAPGFIWSGAKAVGSAAKAVPGLVSTGAKAVGSAAKAVPELVSTGAKKVPGLIEGANKARKALKVGAAALTGAVAVKKLVDAFKPLPEPVQKELTAKSSEILNQIATETETPAASPTIEIYNTGEGFKTIRVKRKRK